MAKDFLDALGSGFDADMSYEKSANPFINFFVKKGMSRDCIFLTHEKETKLIWEHTVNVYGQWMTFTCAEMMELACPLCQLANITKNYYKVKVQVLTVIDPTPFTKKNGEVVNFTKKLFKAKKPTIELLSRKVELLNKSGKQFKYSRFSCFRAQTGQTANVGNDFTYVDHPDLTQYGDISELDYRELLMPKPEEMKEVFKRLVNSASGGASTIMDKKEETKEEGADGAVKF